LVVAPTPLDLCLLTTAGQVSIDAG
jgi:hypothetical protein